MKTFTPDQYEVKDGYFKDGLFYCPRYGIFRNGKRLEPMGLEFAYPHKQAYHTLMHLQAVSNDTFTLEPVAWKAVENYSEVAEVQP